MGFWGKIGLTATIGFTMLTNLPQNLWTGITKGKDAMNKSLAEQLVDAVGGGGGSVLPSIPPEEIEVPVTIVQPTIWDNLSVVLSEPLNLLIIGFVIIGGAYLIKSVANKVFGRSA